MSWFRITGSTKNCSRGCLTGTIDAPREPPMPLPQFDPSPLKLQPLARRQHDLTLADLLPLDAPADLDHPALPVLAQRLIAAKKAGAARMLVMGAHVLRAGVQ